MNSDKETWQICRASCFYARRRTAQLLVALAPCSKVNEFCVHPFFGTLIFRDNVPLTWWHDLVASPLLATEETGAMEREIESRQGIPIRVVAFLKLPKKLGTSVI
jgi:hypothetical protein